MFLNIPIPIKPISEAELGLTKAVAFHKAITNSHFSAFISCGVAENGDEVIVFEVQPEVSQQVENDIRYTERLAIHFEAADKSVPWVFALRESFPSVPHLNMLGFDKPRSLCLYETQYDELRLSWSGVRYLERIRNWLTLTSEDSLHQPGQPREPLLLNSRGNIIIPQSIDLNDQLFVYIINGNQLNLIGFNEEQPTRGKSHLHIATCVNVTSGDDGVIRQTPKNLFELHSLVLGYGVNLIEDIIKPTLKPYLGKPNFHKHKLIIVIQDSVTGSTFSFLLVKGIEEIAIDLNLWYKHQGILGEIIPATEFAEDIAKMLGLWPLTTYFMFSKNQARIFNGISDEANNEKVALIGVGALGSQLFMNQTRMGVGRWTLIDHDYLLPHNLARHALHEFAIGRSKAISLAEHANDLLGGSEFATAIVENILRPQEKDELLGLLKAVDLIVDVSASVPVERSLVNDYPSSTRKVSFFLNPIGKDLVMLLEGQEKTVPLDCIEMQYYRLLLANPELSDHLYIQTGEVRYSTSCRDISGVMKQDIIAMFAGLASQMVRKIPQIDSGKITIWRSKDELISTISADLYKVIQRHGFQDGWKVYIDEYVVTKMGEARLNKLPKETGGILIGSLDMQRNIIYIVDTMLSPADSEEYPTSYRRGIKGVDAELKRIEQLTAGNLIYIGEWHSHPENCSLQQSTDDKILFKWMQDNMDKIEQPAVMLILGDNNNFEIYV